MKHVVTVTYSDPTHDFMSMKGRTKSTNYVVEARNVNEAQLRASSYFRSMGYKIHSATIVEQKKEVPAPTTLSEDHAYTGTGSIDKSNSPGHKFPTGHTNTSTGQQKTPNNIKPTPKPKTPWLLPHPKPKGMTPPVSIYVRPNKPDPRYTQMEETQYIEEKLSASDGVDKWIHDFVHSDNPKFEGKSKKERIQQALGAYYDAKREGSVKEEVEQIDEISKEKLGKYINAADDNASLKNSIALNMRLSAMRKRKSNPLKAKLMAGADEYDSERSTRLQKMDLARKKLGYLQDVEPKAKVMATEEVTPGAKGKITHIVAKDKLQDHADEMDSEGYDTHTKELPANHPKAKTHIGIVAQSPVEGDYHESMGHAEPIHEGSMSPAVKAAQAKFDAQTKAQQKKPVQAGTLAAKARREAQVAEGAEDPSNILSVIKAAAKSKTLAKQASPKIELGLSKDNPVNEKGPKDEDITEAVEGKETDGRESKTEVKNKEAKSTEKETAVAKAKDETVKKKKNPVVINPEAKHAGVGSMSINTMAVGGSSGSTGGGGYSA